MENLVWCPVLLRVLVDWFQCCYLFQCLRHIQRLIPINHEVEMSMGTADPSTFSTLRASSLGWGDLEPQTRHELTTPHEMGLLDVVPLWLG